MSKMGGSGMDLGCLSPIIFRMNGVGLITGEYACFLGDATEKKCVIESLLVGLASDAHKAVTA